MGTDGVQDGRLASAPTPSGKMLAQFVRECIEADDRGWARHIDLDLGDVDSLSLESALYALLGISDDTAVLVGICRLNSGDIAACRAEWGEPTTRVDLRSELGSDLCWDVWRVSGALLRDESFVGPGLVLLATAPRWVLYTRLPESSPMLFPSHNECQAHSTGGISSPTRE